MAGVTNASFRRLCREMAEAALPESLRPSCPGPLPTFDGGLLAPAGLYVTEMVTTRALVERNERTLAMVRTDPAERVRSIQLYGVDPATVGAAVRILVEEDLADHIDLNFGCPVPKVTRKGGGAALPWKRDLLAAILTEAVRASEAAVLAVASLTTASLVERTGEFALLKAIGASSASVNRLILAETAVLGLAGTAVGALVGSGLAQLIGRIVFDSSITMRPMVYVLVVALISLVLLVATASSMRSILKIQPATALHRR